MWFQGKAKKMKTEDVKQTDGTAEGKEKKVEEDEEIPQLVPITTPSKKPKLEVSPTRHSRFKRSN